jgi:RND family efflux transporter MFP subunit
LTLAENELHLAENTSKLRSEALTPSDRALAEIHIKQAEEKLATLDVQISYANIYAPCNGIITDQFQFQGEFATSGAKLLTIADTSEVIVKVSFSDTVAKSLKLGDSITIFPSDLAGESFVGEISLISNTFDPQSRTVEVWGKFKNDQGKLHIGGIAQTVVTTAQVPQAVVVPVSAVTLEASNETQGTVIVIDKDSVAHETKVSIGIRTPEQMQITSGLQGNEIIVTQGNYSLPDGTKVKIVKPNEDKKNEDKDDAKKSGKDDDKTSGKQE